MGKIRFVRANAISDSHAVDSTNRTPPFKAQTSIAQLCSPAGQLSPPPGLPDPARGASESQVPGPMTCTLQSRYYLALPAAEEARGWFGDPQAPLPAHPTTKVSQPCKSTCTARWRWSHWGAGFGGLRAAPPGRSRAGRSAATQPPPVREPPPHPVEGYERSIAPVSACAVHCNAAESSIHESKKAVDGRKS